MNEPSLRRFETWDELTATAADAVVGALHAGLQAREEASLAVAGGRTPGDIYRRLSTQSLDWSRVVVTLTDERWIDPASPESNARLLGETLLQDRAASARFIPLNDPSAVSPEAAAAVADTALAAAPWPLDAVLLGMGDDGHIASLFPGNSALTIGLDPEALLRCIAVPAGEPAPPQPRLSLTLRALLDTRLLLLVIRGAGKLDALDRAREPDAAAPVATLLRQTGAPVSIFWAP